MFLKTNLTVNKRGGKYKLVSQHRKKVQPNNSEYKNNALLPFTNIHTHSAGWDMVIWALFPHVF